MYSTAGRIRWLLWKQLISVVHILMSSIPYMPEDIGYPLWILIVHNSKGSSCFQLQKNAFDFQVATGGVRGNESVWWVEDSEVSVLIGRWTCELYWTDPQLTHMVQSHTPILGVKRHLLADSYLKKSRNIKGFVPDNRDDGRNPKVVNYLLMYAVLWLMMRCCN